MRIKKSDDIGVSVQVRKRGTNDSRTFTVHDTTIDELYEYLRMCVQRREDESQRAAKMS